MAAAADSSSPTSPLAQGPKQSWFRLPLFLVIAAVIFGTTAIVGGVVGYMTISQAKATALTIAEEIQTSFMESANSTVRTMLRTTIDLTALQASDIDMGVPIAGLNDDGTLQFAPVKIPIMRSLLFDIPPIAGGFWRPDRAVGPDTFILTYNIPVWKGRMPFKPPTSDPPAANFFSLLSVRSLDAYLQEIPMTPNGVLALVHGDNGMMFGATTANISEAWPNQYPRHRQPQPARVRRGPRRSRGGTRRWTPAVNGTAAIGGIADRTGKSFEFPFAGDTVYCSTAWIVDAPANLALMLVLAVPSSDFLGPVNVTIRTHDHLCRAVLRVCPPPRRAAVVGAGRAAEEVIVSIEKHAAERRRCGHSWIVEIAKLEGSFFTMLKKFAEAVRANKSLVTGGEKVHHGYFTSKADNKAKAKGWANVALDINAAHDINLSKTQVANKHERMIQKWRDNGPNGSETVQTGNNPPDPAKFMWDEEMILMSQYFPQAQGADIGQAKTAGKVIDKHESVLLESFSNSDEDDGRCKRKKYERDDGEVFILVSIASCSFTNDLVICGCVVKLQIVEDIV
ncbi:hypothetical protein DFJ73DRAFT_915631 [Zopfochytrium polystomum]|nr:hypothetical protein DFJ73DRAFT_915631 [Zopfochytrium polystomum]